METNEIIDRLPKHLSNFIIEQPYNSYTARDQAIWRYVMRQNIRYLGKVAHTSYLDGLKKTGISIDQIPHMYGMNRILKEIGWAAVAVDGFIPPAAFMEFQAWNVLVIAADIRPFDQVEYTPAPDIIHEAAGHAPIIADPVYSQYLVRFGELGSKAFSSKEDYRLYEAIRHLSIVKADPYSTPEMVQEAEENLSSMEANMGAPSEMARIRNLHWWTVEYGLIGTLENPQIYGAGLLSSIGESYSALNNGVIKLPYTLDAQHYTFDITKKQPQLFVTPDFETLNTVLEEFADTMAIRRGGLYGIQLAIQSENTATCVYSSGLQVSGTFTHVIEKDGIPVYLKTTGPTTLNYQDKVLYNHGKTHHADGFGSPVGLLAGYRWPLESLSAEDLETISIKKGQRSELLFESGVRVEGKLERILDKNGVNLIMSFSDCTVEYQDEILFRPEWGMYDMAVGAELVSAFSGPADPKGFGLTYPAPVEKTHKIEHSDKDLKLFQLYEQVAAFRAKEPEEETLTNIWHSLEMHYPDDWLLRLEILELLPRNNRLGQVLLENLRLLKIKNPQHTKLIDNGLSLIEENFQLRSQE